VTANDDTALLDAFRRAISDDLLEMMYQPKIRLENGTLDCVEALLRWEDPEHGRINPERMVALAEREDLIEELTRWGLSASLLQWRAWQAQGIETRIAFNISAMSLKRLDFPDLVEALCVELEVPTRCLLIELTEGATQPLVNLMDTLTRFRIKGIALAIDDFGTGYSSLMQLHQLPFTEVKIDRSFISGLGRSADSALIVKTVIELAHGLHMSVTAEGIEKPDQLEQLRELGCDLGQGFLLSPPMKGSQLPAWKERFQATWARGVGQESLDLWRDVEANPLR
jgi:EAL domain-containing protein (putative c-di-GMP-specific phosphodiesterase class I)